MTGNPLSHEVKRRLQNSTEVDSYSGHEMVSRMQNRAEGT